MPEKLFSRALFLTCLVAQLAQAEVKEYVRDYNYHGTDFDTRDTSRVNAIDGVKRELLEELGTYVGSVVKMNQDSLGNSYMSHDVINITAGIVAMKVLNEKWNQPEYFVKAGLKADPDDVLTKLKAMRADLELEKSLRESHEELQNSRNEVAKLKAQLAQMMLARDLQSPAKPPVSVVVAPLVAISKPPAPEPPVLPASSLNAKSAQVELAHDIAADKSVTVADAKPIAAPMKAQPAQVTVAAKPLPVSVPVINSAPAPAPSPEEKMLVAKYVKAVQSVDVETAYQRALLARKNGDFDSLFREMSELAEKGYARAQLRMGWIHERGLGVPQDYQKALGWYLKAQAGGDIDANAHIGRLYEHGWGVEKDYAKAADYYQRAINEGSSAGYVRMGYLYETGKGVKLNWEKAVENYQIAIDKGNFHGLSRLGLMYQKGEGVLKNVHKAAVLFQQGIDHGDPLAMTRLSMLHINGVGGVSKDHDKAVALLRESMRYKLPASFAHLGYMYEQGFGVKQDYIEAKRLFEKGAELDAPFAEYRLGMMYKAGKGVDQDQQKAKYWFDRAASKGFDVSSRKHSNLGKME